LLKREGRPRAAHGRRVRLYEKTETLRFRGKKRQYPVGEKEGLGIPGENTAVLFRAFAEKKKNRRLPRRSNEPDLVVREHGPTPKEELQKEWRTSTLERRRASSSMYPQSEGGTRRRIAGAGEGGGGAKKNGLAKFAFVPLKSESREERRCDGAQFLGGKRGGGRVAFARLQYLIPR